MKIKMKMRFEIYKHILDKFENSFKIQDGLQVGLGMTLSYPTQSGLCIILNKNLF